MGKNKQILLIELKFHQEIIPTQLLFLLSKGYETHLLLPEKLWDEDLLGCFRDRIHVKLLKKTKGIFNKIKLLVIISMYIRKNKISHIILNTLESNFHNMLLCFVKNVSKIGIVHQAARLKHEPAYMRNIERMNGVLTLSDYTHKYIIDNFDLTKNLSAFYPIFFCQNHPVVSGTQQLNHKKEIIIVVPGQLELKKRDYEQLINAVQSVKNLLPPLKFYLLGNASANDGPRIISKIKAKQLEHYFYFSNSFVSYRDFFNIISTADYIMPLLNKQDGETKYQSSQISASFNWAYGFNKHLLIDHHFTSNVISRKLCTEYTTESLNVVLCNLKKPQPINVAEETNNYLSYQTQSENYFRAFQ